MIEDSTPRPLHARRHFGRLPGCGARSLVRSLWSEPALAAGRGSGWCCRCVELGSAGGWDAAIAPYVLCEPEWKLWRSLSRAAARRRWMRGRVAAKDAVRLLLLDRHDVVAPLEAICVLPDERGQPSVSFPALPGMGAGIAVSISHCGDSSVALAAERTETHRGVGIDVASQEDNHDGLAEGGFVPIEMALLADCPAVEQTDWLLRMWCAKEAVAKALGVGLMGNPLKYVVRRVNRARSTVVVEAQVDRRLAAPLHVSAIMTTHVGCDRGTAFAVAWLE